MMMKELYDISLLFFLRCLREFEKWSKVEKMRKNRQKMRKMAAPESPNIHYLRLVRNRNWGLVRDWNIRLTHSFSFWD